MIYVFVNLWLLACVIVESGFHRMNYIVLRVRSVVNTDLRKEVNFPKSMIRDFKHFLRYPIFQFQDLGLCTAITRIKLFSKSDLRISRMTHFFYRFLRFRLRIDPCDLFGDMICTTGEECFQCRIEEGSQFFEIDAS